VSGRGEPSTVGVLQDWIENRGDGWSHVVDILRQSAGSPTDEALRRDILALGATTADFHAALAVDPASPAFAPEPATAADAEAWRATLSARATHTLALVQRSLSGWGESTRRMGESLLDLRRRVAAQAPDLSATAAQFQKIRIHGDYHLGQTLKTAGGFVLIDFEGEPARPLAERRGKYCALKDVAGMIRSFDYAVETAGRYDPDASDIPPCAVALREWFLEGYLSAAARQGAVFLPRDRRAIDAWIAFFELEKALYELEYEINTRPAWVHIPLRGILRILRGRARQEKW
jgi:trehalose synthase-fused probable maltokinase